MSTTKLFLMTVTMIGMSTVSFAQDATQAQQQKTEAASAGQAAKTEAATQSQAQKTQAATGQQATKTQASTQDQAQKTQASAQKQANETNAAVQRQPGQPQLNQPEFYLNQPVSTGGAIIYGAGAAAAEAPPPRLYNTGVPNSTAIGSNAAEKPLQDLFNTIDTDHSGTISKTEFSIYYTSPPDDPRFDAYDTNRDMMITYFEFRAPNITGAGASIPSH